jgi:hypothetical protein
MAYNPNTMSFDLPETDTVYVSGMPAGVSEGDIAEFFGSIGIIKLDKKTKTKKIYLYRDKATGEMKGDGTVSYEDPFSAASAVEWFHNKDWKGGSADPSQASYMRCLLRNGRCLCGSRRARCVVMGRRCGGLCALPAARGPASAADTSHSHLPQRPPAPPPKRAQLPALHPTPPTPWPPCAPTAGRRGAAADRAAACRAPQAPPSRCRCRRGRTAALRLVATAAAAVTAAVEGEGATAAAGAAALEAGAGAAGVATSGAGAPATGTAPSAATTTLRGAPIATSAAHRAPTGAEGAEGAAGTRWRPCALAPLCAAALVRCSPCLGL